MKNFFKKILFSALAVASLAFTAYAAEAEIPDEHLVTVTETKDEEISIVVVGNSILGHGKAESIGWYGEGWGMAASSADKDYFHILKNKVADMGFTNVKWSTVGVATLERTIDKRMDYAYASEIEQYQ